MMAAIKPIVVFCVKSKGASGTRPPTVSAARAKVAAFMGLKFFSPTRMPVFYTVSSATVREASG
jgi:hypothetical protein